ncbi:MAG: DUF5664 domain-containing protein [Thiopseudomonas sp.]|nr:DUF5664 domain-containing protein [Thiopseudomonas sp.]
MQTKGIKHDHGKPRPDLIFIAMARALLEVSKVAAMGAEKYDDDNWLIVDDALKRYRDAKGRHLLLGATHLAHEAWNALAVLELHLRKLDPPKQVAENWPASADDRMVPIFQNGNDGAHYDEDQSWIEYDGTGCPTNPKSIVAVKLRSGTINSPRPAEDWNWVWREGGKFQFDITHYNSLPPGDE